MKPKWILLADDDLDDCEMLENAIHSAAPGATVRVFHDGKQVKEYIEGNDGTDLPCTIVLDYNMPFLNGSEVLKHINAYSLYDNIPKIVWSTSRQQKYINASLELGAKDYLFKPDNVSDLAVVAKKIITHCKTGS